MLTHVKEIESLYQRIRKVKYEYCSREIVYRHRQIKLYHYHSKVGKQKKRPLLIVFATINRPEILDLQKQSSFIGDLLQQHMDVYLLDWGMPKTHDPNLNFDDYVHSLSACIQSILKRTKVKKINLLGICQGGLISLCYTALEETIKNLVLISTPVDFNARNFTLAKMVKKMKIENIDQIPGAWLTQFFISLRPFEFYRKYLRLLEHRADHEWRQKFLRIEKWLFDAPNQHGSAFTQLVNDFFKNNKLIKGHLRINKKKITLNQIAIPILNIAASTDALIPKEAVLPLKRLVKSADYTQKIVSGGHIGIYVSDKARPALAKSIADWLKERA